ncbi:flagellar biosynthesis anti-sigma factor FlgM [Halopseudomonas pachastrellae]|uniref:flagellar biosynthesis anti-sigma factor FlgM n=1 Tax=Halopseudomonas pachastrellae TaxID=254161 RepID=UPI003D7D6B2B|tara:strand:- start:4266 stop:4592 length:327 start_codon:yes stop_codon:yes gene_type:complete
MVIDFNSPNGANGVGRNSQANSAAAKREAGAVNDQSAQTAAQPAEQGDAPSSVNLSAQAQQLQAIEEKLRELPEVDSERVSQLRQAIADGSYKPDSGRIADKLLNLEG